jgi:glycosyltransferase involved in cell wall biosynthesis/SAM-dependent methyltransferase
VDRKDLIRHPFTKDSKLIEIGASYNPTIPKADGWNTTIIDHADQSGLRKKYHDQPPGNIEPVDYVWQDGSLDDLIPASEHGTYDGLIASHVGEHITDPIGFFLALDRILKPDGIVALALPDLRVCFDFYRPRSTTGDVLDARGRVRHRRGKVFDNFAYWAVRGNIGGWAYGPGENVKLTGDVKAAYEQWKITGEAASDPYTDAHGWCFTPASFQLIMFELYVLDVIPWAVTRVDPASGVEFYVWLERQRLKPSDADVATRRAKLLDDIIHESEEQLRQTPRPAVVYQPVVLPPPAPVSESDQNPEPAVLALPAPITPELTVTAIIPLYNGAKFIIRSMNSVLAQTVKPIELFIIDDGSTDDGASVVRDYIANTELHGVNVQLFGKENGGQSSARNFGVGHATGDLIGFLDQDDEWYPLHIEKLREPFIDQPPGAPLGWVYSNLDHADADGNVMFRNWLPAHEHPKTDLFSCLSRDMFILPSAALISRVAFNEVGGFDNELSGYEDDDLFMRIFRVHGNAFINEPLSKWCIHHASSSYTYRMVKSRNHYCKKLLTMFPDDDARSIHYARDLILPRFYPQAISEYQKALADGTNMERIADTHAMLRYLLHRAESNGIHRFMNARKARRLRRVMDVITPSRALTAYKARRFVRPLARRVFL